MPVPGRHVVGTASRVRAARRPGLRMGCRLRRSRFSCGPAAAKPRFAREPRAGPLLAVCAVCAVCGVAPWRRVVIGGVFSGPDVAVASALAVRSTPVGALPRGRPRRCASGLWRPPWSARSGALYGFPGRDGRRCLPRLCGARSTPEAGCARPPSGSTRGDLGPHLPGAGTGAGARKGRGSAVASLPAAEAGRGPASGRRCRGAAVRARTARVRRPSAASPVVEAGGRRVRSALSWACVSPVVPLGHGGRRVRMPSDGARSPGMGTRRGPPSSRWALEHPGVSG